MRGIGRVEGGKKNDFEALYVVGSAEHFVV